VIPALTPLDKRIALGSSAEYWDGKAKRHAARAEKLRANRGKPFTVRQAKNLILTHDNEAATSAAYAAYVRECRADDAARKGAKATQETEGGAA
jgi:hypothetical protein